MYVKILDADGWSVDKISLEADRDLIGTSVQMKCYLNVDDELLLRFSYITFFF